MKVAIHQPHYFPWLGYLDKIHRSDTFILLDSVQFCRRNFQHRTRLPGRSGPAWLTLPVHAPRHQLDRLEIRHLNLAEPWPRVGRKHFETLRHRYHRAEGWHEMKPKLEAYYLESRRDGTPSVLTLLRESLAISLELFGIDATIQRASEIGARGRKDELMLELTRSVGGTTYLSGQGAKAYMREEIFRRAGVALQYQEFEHPVYSQSLGESFTAGCTALDYYASCPEAATALFAK